MTHIVTLELPEEAARSAKSVALRTQRRLEDVLVEWIDHAAAELPVEYLPDDQVLALCDLQLDSSSQEELSELLAANREGTLTREARTRLDQVMQAYRHGLVRKAHALKEAVARGLRAPLN
jgi:hypothetical protein